MHVMRSRDLNRMHFSLRKSRVWSVSRKRNRGVYRSLKKKCFSVVRSESRTPSKIGPAICSRSCHAPIPKNRFVQECYNSIGVGEKKERSRRMMKFAQIKEYIDLSSEEFPQFRPIYLYIHTRTRVRVYVNIYIYIYRWIPKRRESPMYRDRYKISFIINGSKCGNNDAQRRRNTPVVQ